MSEQQSKGGTGKFISHPNQRTLHRGTREDGAKCGVGSDSWGRVDAKNPLDAVVNYATPPCTRCFNHTRQLAAIYKKVHSAAVVHRDMDELTKRLPWSIDSDTDRREVSEE
jgi:hypothetical protein